jgi:hypothetical protein
VKNIGIILALIFSGALVGTTTAVYYYWSQATRLPTWYTQQAATPPTEETLDEARARIMQRLTVTRDEGAGAEVEGNLDSTEFNQLLMGAIADDSAYRPLLETAKGFNTSIEGDRLKTGAVVNLADLSAQLQPQQQEVLQRLTEQFPDLVNRDVYVGIEGQPVVENNQLQLDDSTVVQIGELQMPLSQVASQLGISEAQLRDLSVGLAIGDINIEDIEFADNQALIRGRAQ